MKRIFILAFILIVGHVVCKAQSTIYAFSIDPVSGDSSINFSSFAGKKILLVNITSADPDSTQLNELETLYQLYKDSLVIIGIPSNSFNTEPKNNIEMAGYYSAYPLHFIISAKTNVKGESAHALYKWLAEKSKNGLINSPVTATFQKYLFNEAGELRGVFGRKTRPMSETFRHFIDIL